LTVKERPYSHNIFDDKYIFDDKDIFEPQVSLSHGKLLAQDTLHSFLGLPWLGQGTYGSKINFYCNIFFSFYRNIGCQNVSCE